MVREPFSIRAWTMPTNIQSRRGKDFVTKGTRRFDDRKTTRLSNFTSTLFGAESATEQLDQQLPCAASHLFNDKANCASCHVPSIFTEPGWNLHTAEEIGIDAFQATRAPDNRYRTEPLRALFDTQKIHKGGFYHDGRSRLSWMW